MITTEFLLANQFYEYGSWLKGQDSETLYNFFGLVVDSESIDQLIEKFSKSSKNNHFLIAKINGKWAGTIHIATQGQEVEFGVIVAVDYRKQGIANQMMDEAITWVRNRFYTKLFMHCISWNLPIQRLCKKHGLVPRNMMGDAEATIHLKPPTPATYLKEQITSQRNWFAHLNSNHQ